MAKSAEVLPDGRLGRQGAGDDLACDVVLDVTVRLAPRESGADSAPEPARLLRLAGPQRGQDSQRVLAIDEISAHVPENTICVTFERGRPVPVCL